MYLLVNDVENILDGYFNKTINVSVLHFEQVNN